MRVSSLGSPGRPKSARSRLSCFVGAARRGADRPPPTGPPGNCRCCPVIVVARRLFFSPRVCAAASKTAVNGAMVARTGRASLREEARAGWADACDERGAERAESPPPPPTIKRGGCSSDVSKISRKIGSDVDVTSLGTTSRTLHSATHAPNSPPTSRLSPLFRTLSEMGQAATKLGHGGARVATSKRAPRGVRFCLPRSREKISRNVRCRPPPRPRRAKRPARSSLPTRVSRVSTVTARTAARARATLTRLDREPGSVRSSVVHALFIPACRIPIRL